jgi:hypothetical protein
VARRSGCGAAAARLFPRVAGARTGAALLRRQRSAPALTRCRPPVWPPDCRSWCPSVIRCARRDAAAAGAPACRQALHTHCSGGAARAVLHAPFLPAPLRSAAPQRTARATAAAPPSRGVRKGGSATCGCVHANPRPQQPSPVAVGAAALAADVLRAHRHAPVFNVPRQAWYRSWNSPYYNESHHTFRAKIRAFTEKEIMPFCHEWDEAKTLPKELFEKAAAAGWLPVCVGAWPTVRAHARGCRLVRCLCN